MFHTDPSVWSESLPEGSLVSPIKTIFLTPFSSDDYEYSNWPEWQSGELGIVLVPFNCQSGIRVLVHNGIGLCFIDEIRVHVNTSSM